MLNRIIFSLCLIIPLSGYSQDKTDSIISQIITYYTTKATEVYLVWGIDDWSKPPAKEFQPEQTFIKRDMAWSKMTGNKDSFSIIVRSPKGTIMNFMIWIPKDSAGKSTDGWDTYGEQTYSGDFNENRTILLKDSALWIPSTAFNILHYGWLFISLSAILFILSWVIHRRKISFSKYNFLTGMLGFYIMLSVVTRYQMNDWFEKNRLVIFGAICSDLLWLLLLIGPFLLFLYFTRNNRIISYILTTLAGLLILVSVLYSLINILIVDQIGNPLNYQWLYYADFMNGVDAKNAISHNLTSTLTINLTLLTGSVLLFGLACAFFKNRSRKFNIGWAACFILLFVACFYQTRRYSYQAGKIDNPFITLISSSIMANKQSQLFSMKVSQQSRQYVEALHTSGPLPAFDTAHAINNIVIFVLESTPFKYISLYDSTYRVTPNLEKWKNISLVYKNMYAHIPATPNSMGNIVSGVYPLLSYQSFVANYPYNTIPSIPNELATQNWVSSLFFASDLKFSRMGDYAKGVGFTHIEDYRNIQCVQYKKFDNTHTSLDGIDDRCLIESYFKWQDNDTLSKKLAMMWTNQTHYPYVTSAEEIGYSSANKELNHYLNALKTDDEAFGLLMEGLVKRNILDNTLVIVIADHGEAFGTHNQYSHASKIYEENVHIPCIFFNPVHFHGTTNPGIGGLIDIAPTIIHIAGLQKPGQWQGKSLLSGTPGERTFFICPYSDFLFGTRSTKWKYIFNATKNEEELYDLSNDPAELNNVADKYPAIAKTEHEVLAAWVQYHNGKLKNSFK